MSVIYNCLCMGDRANSTGKYLKECGPSSKWHKMKSSSRNKKPSGRYNKIDSLKYSPLNIEEVPENMHFTTVTTLRK